MNIRKRLLAVLATLLVAGGLVAVQATPAHASIFNCPSGAVCGWDGTSWDGNPSYYWTITATGGGCINIGSPWNDQFDSMYNAMNGNANSYIIGYTNSNCSNSVIVTLSVADQGNCHDTYEPWNLPCGGDGNSSKMSSFWYYRF
jgi:hypothetical protein